MKTQGNELHPRKDQHRLKETGDNCVYELHPRKDQHRLKEIGDSCVYNTY